MAEFTDDQANALDIEELVQGRNLLAAALVCAIAFLPLILSSKGGLFGFLCLMIAFLGGLAGTSRVARALDFGILKKYAALLSAMMPLLNILSFGYFLMQSQTAIKAGREAASREQLRRRQVSSNPRSVNASQPEISEKPRASSPNNARSRIGKAIAQVKIAGLGNLPDGQRLAVNISAPGITLPASAEPVFISAKGTFGVGFVIDQGDSLAYVTTGDMEAAGLSLEELYRIGINNLATLIDSHEKGLRLTPIKDGANGLLLDGHFEASLVLLDHVWEGPLREYAQHAPIVVIPSRDVCAFCDTGSPTGVAVLRGVIERVSASGSHLISDKLFIRNGERWHEYRA